MKDFNFCSECGEPLLPRVVAGEVRRHAYCQRCQSPCYQHAQIVVTVFVACGQRLLWIQRDLEPQRGKWAIPGGFLERGETLAEGAARELREEAGVCLEADKLSLYMTGTITFINQVYVGFRATIDEPVCHPGVESMDCGFFSSSECPWEALAYPQVNNSIRQAYADLEQGRFSIWQAEMTDSNYRLEPVRQGR
ncbi:MAG: NUDIX domain-containing protein [Pseudomonadota bacterium]